jgi:hypothetical protein
VSYTISECFGSGLLPTMSLTKTIVSTSVATIVADFGDASGYTWIGTSFLLARSVIFLILLTKYGSAPSVRKSIRYMGPKANSIHCARLL